MIKRLLHTTSLSANVIANFAGSAYTAFLSLIFVPFYLNYLGAEAYGLIGIFTGMQVVLQLLDGGLSTTLNREVARLTALENSARQMRNLVKSLGTVYWAIAILAGLIATGISPLMAKYWIQPKGLDPQTIIYALLLLSISLVFQFPTGFYSGGLLGLQKQVALNISRVIFGTLKSAGALLVLIFISHSILAFFLWIAIISMIQAFFFKYLLWRLLPESGEPAVFDKLELKNVSRFAANLTGIGITSVLLTQVDTAILSKILPLADFGYYSLAFTVGSVSYVLVGPVYQSYFPKFSGLAALNDEENLKKLYHQGCQLVTLVVLPFSLFFSLFSRDILLIWTKNITTTEHTWQMVSVIVLAVAIHCLMFLPYMLCLAYNYTRLALYTNIIILAVLVPCTIVAALKYGGLGGAVCWLSVNVIYLFLNPLLLHQRILKGEVRKWYWNDTLRAAGASLAVLLVFKYLFSIHKFGGIANVLLLAFAGIMSFITALWFLPEMKATALRQVKRIQNRSYGK